MVSEHSERYRYKFANSAELDALLSGHTTDGEVLLAGDRRWSRPPLCTAGVIWAEEAGNDAIARPLVLISHEDELRRLCGRHASLRSALSPLSAWCHLITPSFAQELDSLTRTPRLRGMEASWTGLAVAEAVLLAAKPIASVRVAACLATQSFAIARSISLWEHVSIDGVTGRLDNAQRICRSERQAGAAQRRIEELRSSLMLIWEALAEASSGLRSPSSRDLAPVVACLHALQKARSMGSTDEARAFIEPLLPILPE